MIVSESSTLVLRIAPETGASTCVALLTTGLWKDKTADRVSAGEKFQKIATGSTLLLPIDAPTVPIATAPAATTSTSRL